MNIRRFVVGPLATNCYLVSAREAAVVDPGGISPELSQALWNMGIYSTGQALEAVHLAYILLTHAHFDHADAAWELHAKTHAPILYHPEEKVILPNLRRPPLGKPLRDGDRLPLGGEELLVWHLPGHSPGSVGYLWEPGKVIFCGDVLFRGSVGRTDLVGGSPEDLENSLRRMLRLGDDWRVLPGHGPETELGRERVQNTFLVGIQPSPGQGGS
jgi:glyoxylase-like metal-dependent hydrolase (beta-lactamase superfamily II)